MRREVMRQRLRRALGALAAEAWLLEDHAAARGLAHAYVDWLNTGELHLEEVPSREPIVGDHLRELAGAEDLDAALLAVHARTRATLFGNRPDRVPPRLTGSRKLAFKLASALADGLDAEGIEALRDELLDNYDTDHGGVDGYAVFAALWHGMARHEHSPTNTESSARRLDETVRPDAEGLTIEAWPENIQRLVPILTAGLLHRLPELLEQFEAHIAASAMEDLVEAVEDAMSDGAAVGEWLQRVLIELLYLENAAVSDDLGDTTRALMGDLRGMVSLVVAAASGWTFGPHVPAMLLPEGERQALADLAVLAGDLTLVNLQFRRGVESEPLSWSFAAVDTVGLGLALGIR